MLIKMTTSKALPDTAADLEIAVKQFGFGIMHVHDLKDTMVKKAIEFYRECLIYEVCQPQQAKKVLEQNMSLSTMLPCRISLFVENNQTVLAALRPTALVEWFKDPYLHQLMKEVEDILLKIMTSVTQETR